MPKPRALIVEDSDEFVILTTTLLEAEGFDVTSVGTAAQGISSARELDPDLVILDITLPDGLGYEVCRTIREEEPVRPSTRLSTMPSPPPKGRSSTVLWRSLVQLRRS